LDSAEILQKQAFLEPPKNDGVAPRWNTAAGRVAIIEPPVAMTNPTPDVV
jgi:hypothetical protein